MQTFAGLALDAKHKKGDAPHGTPVPPSGRTALNIQHLFNAFLVLNVLQFCALLFLAHLDRQRKAANILAVNSHLRSPVGILTGDLDRDHIESSTHSDYGSESSIHIHEPAREGPLPSASSPDQRLSLLIPNFVASRSRKSKRIQAGHVYAGLCLMLIVFAWVLFLVTAWLRLRSKAERGGT